MRLRWMVISLMFLMGTAFSLPNPQQIDPEKLYKSNCRICHGIKGKLGINGASDLTKSTLSTKEIQAVISDGRGLMTPFKSILSEKEIKALAKYLQKMKK